MKVCDYCGRKNPDGAAFCAGCGTSLAEANRSGLDGPAALEVPLGRPVALGLALAVMWTPFFLCAALSGDKQNWRYILMLPGAVPVVFLHLRAREPACYIASGLMTLAVVGLALVLERRSSRAFKLALAPALLVFCAMAFLTLLMLVA